MEKTINKFSAIFTRESFLTASVTATLTLYAVNLVAKLLCGLYSLFILDAVFFLCVAALFIAYCRHNKNVQKGLLGAVLMWYLYDEINYAIGSILFDSEVFTHYDYFWGRGKTGSRTPRRYKRDQTVDEIHRGSSDRHHHR